MKRLLFCLSIGAALALSSCTTTEEIWVNQDGSLRREYVIDMSGLMPFIKMAQEAEDSTAVEMENPANEPSETVAGEPEAGNKKDDFEKVLSELMKRENVDTIISFRSLMAEAMEGEGMSEEQLWQSLAEDDEVPGEVKNTLGGLLKVVMDARLRIKMNEAENIYLFGLIQDFESAEEMNVMQDAFALLSALGGEGEGPGAESSAEGALRNMMGGQPAEYSLEKKKFRIYRPAADLAEVPEEAQENLQMMQMFMGSMEYQYVIHFPKKVKKVNIKGAEIDGNTVRVAAPMLEPGKKNEAFELIVKFK